MTLNWHELQMAGMPAILRALEQLDKRLTDLASQYNLLQHQVHHNQTNLEELSSLMAALEVKALSSRLADLEYLMSEEIMAGLGKPAAIRETVADLGHGWRIERQPAPPNGDGATYTPAPVATAGTPGDSWLPNSWVTQFAAASDAKGDYHRQGGTYGM